MKKIRKGDMVKVLSGKDRNKTGKVVQVMLGSNGLPQVVVEGVNKLNKHIRARRNSEKGQKIELPAPIPMSRVMLIDSKTNKPVRVGFAMEGTTKVRISKKTGESVA